MVVQMIATYEELMQELAKKDAILASKEQELEQERRARIKAERESLYLQKWREATRERLMNENSAPASRLLAWAELDINPDAVLNCKTVDIDVEQVYKHVGISRQTATNYFNAVNEVGGAVYKDDTGQNDTSGKHFTVKHATYTPEHGKTPLNASKTVQKLKEDTRKRQAAKALEAATCSRCGKPHSHLAVLPYCNSCQELDTAAAMQIVEVGNLLTIEPEPDEQKIAPVPSDEPEPAAAAEMETAEPSQFSGVPFSSEDYTPYEPLPDYEAYAPSLDEQETARVASFLERCYERRVFVELKEETGQISIVTDDDELFEKAATYITQHETLVRRILETGGVSYLQKVKG